MVENSDFPHSSLNFLHIIHDKSRCSILCILNRIMLLFQPIWILWRRKIKLHIYCGWKKLETQKIFSVSQMSNLLILFGNWLWTFRILALILMFVLMLVLIIITCLYADIFKFDPDFLENEDKYKEIKRGKYSLIILVLLQSSVFV